MIPRLHFAHLPTPIEHLPRLGDAIGLKRLFVKRDDQTGLAFGGNKTRKLEFLMADAIASEARTLITTGSIQSNHCRQTAAIAAKYGLNCTLILMGETPDRYSGNLLLDGLLGAKIIWTKTKNHREKVLAETYEKAINHGEQPYLIPYGGSNPIGALGYAYAVEELLDQGIMADWIVFASSSGGTQAGLVLGARFFNFQGQILGISVDEPRDVLSEHVAAIATLASVKLGKAMDFLPGEILVEDKFSSIGYGVFTDHEREAINLFAKTEGLLLDPVYTGRAAAGLIELARNGFFRSDDTIIFLHTGGQPAIFVDSYQNMI